VFENKKVLAPEYGGDGALTSGGTSPVNCATVNQPLATFGAHWAPNGMTFYDGNQFPEKFRGGAFVAFHGGFDRAPLPNEGYKVMFVPMAANNTLGTPEVFADGFAGSTGALPQTAQHRPVGVTVGPDGSLYVSDDRGGRIYRIIFRGQ
jgi:glucose/arabinose dehydrogenase